MTILQMRFEGGRELGDALRSLPHRVSRRFQLEALREGAEPIRRAMAVHAPHAPGKPDLRDMMVVSTARGEDRLAATVAVGPSRAGFYGIFQEFGTVHHGAQPFARPGLDEGSPRALTTIGRALWRQLASRGIGRSVTRPTGVIGGPGGGGLV